VIIPSTCALDVLKPCLEGVLERTTYPELEVLVVGNAVRDEGPPQREYLASIERRSRVHLLSYDCRPFNFSKLNNWAAKHAQGTVLCFLNDDTEAVEPDWLSAMVAHVVRAHVAVVGAKLLYPNGRIQHAGAVLGAGGVAAHTYARRRRDISGYHDRALVDQDVSCVTAACMVARRDVFLDIGGFDEALGIAFNDVDLCVRIRDAGWRIVWTPDAVLYHKESASIGRHNVGEREDEWAVDYDLVRRRWGRELLSDPHYNLNLSLDPLQLWEPADPPRVAYPWRLAAHTRNRAARSRRLRRAVNVERSYPN
jgi:O-antigen biosynthesis protein